MPDPVHAWAAVAQFEKPRFGRFRDDGSFEEVPPEVAENEDCGDCRWVGGQHDAMVARAVLAALAKAGRLAPEVKGDVLLKAYDEAVEVYAGISGEIESDALHAAVVAASGIVAADAERRVRTAVLEEARLKAGAHSCAKYGDHDAQLLAQRVSIDIADAIGALKKDDKCSTP